jgi:Trk-type K+ transport system membrane component
MIHRGTGRILNREPVNRAFGIALTWAGLYVVLVISCLMLLLSTQPQLGADRLLFLAISAASNVGITHEPVKITGTGLYVLSATMLIGRLLPIGGLWWQALTTNDSELLVA